VTEGFSTPEREPYLVLAQEIMRRVYSDEPAEEINAWCAAQLHKLLGTQGENVRLSWADSFPFYAQLMEKRAQISALPEKERKELTWPWPSWNAYLDPLEPGLLAVLAAGDGVGKTIVAECIAEHWARQGRCVAFLHFELNRAIMMDRRAARHTGIPRRILKGGVLTTPQHMEMARAESQLKEWPGQITYLHTPGWSVERSLAEVRALSAEGLCDVFIVDYLEKATASTRQLRQYGANVFAREANDVEIIKDFAEANEIAALLLAQLNKLGKGQTFENLDRTAIEGSGAKSNRANVVILLHRDSPESEALHVRLDKNTIGPPGSFEQWMEAPRFRIMDRDDQQKKAPPRFGEKGYAF
jgi:replicative DNA helicase